MKRLLLIAAMIALPAQADGDGCSATCQTE